MNNIIYRMLSINYERCNVPSQMTMHIYFFFPFQFENGEREHRMEIYVVI